MDVSGLLRVVGMEAAALSFTTFLFSFFSFLLCILNFISWRRTDLLCVDGTVRIRYGLISIKCSNICARMCDVRLLVQM